MPILTLRQRRVVLLLCMALGLLLFVWKLGSTGLVDETPPLFAASARAMPETGNWLIPQVNGLPRYDKPPLVYWLMGLIFALPGQQLWNPLGTWASRLPSALATVAIMLALADTLLRWPQGGAAGGRAAPAPCRDGPTTLDGVTALSAALAFALSPLVLAWGRVSVSDALFTCLVALSLLLCWRLYAAPAQPWWAPWLVLALAVLTKGPVAVVLLLLSLGLFAWLQQDVRGLVRRLKPLSGLVLTGVLASPWYALALVVEGRPFWDSFFGYHNLQRFTTVVNNHLQPWWFFAPVLVVASLPATPLLLLGLVRAIGRLRWRLRPAIPLTPEHSLGRFAACWLLAVLIFFSCAATKLPSYWLPATPAAAILISLAARQSPPAAREGGSAIDRWAWALTLGLTLLLAVAFLSGPLWISWIRDPELPTLASEVQATRLPLLGGLLYLLAVLLGLLSWVRRPRLALLAVQLPLVAFVPATLLPLWEIGDQLRGAPVRSMALAIERLARPGEPVAMVGINKPSLHFYSGRVVIFEGVTPGSLVDLADRLRKERRPGLAPSTPEMQPSLLVLIDQGTANLPFWRGLSPQELDRYGLYRLWRVDRRRLEARSDNLRRQGSIPTWERPVPERF